PKVTTRPSVGDGSAVPPSVATTPSVGDGSAVPPSISKREIRRLHTRIRHRHWLNFRRTPPGDEHDITFLSHYPAAWQRFEVRAVLSLGYDERPLEPR